MFSNRNIFIATVVLLAAFMQVLHPVPSPMPTNQIFMILAAVVMVVRAQGDGMRLNYLAGVFLAAVVLSILANDIPAFFRPWSRLMQFLFLFVAASPLLSGPSANRLRRQMTMGVIWASAAIALLSFAGYVLGFGQYMSGIVQSYKGVTSHANFLGMYTMVALVWFAALSFRCTNIREYAIVGACWAACLIVLLLSASRGSTAAGLLGSLAVIYMRLKNSASHMMTAAVVGVGLVLLAAPHLAGYMETMTQKGIDSENMDSAVEATRGYIWELRKMEIAESPWVGVGAYSCDVNLPGADMFYDAATGTIEQGSSYLGMLSQLGWIGFVAYLLVTVPLFWKLFRYAWREHTPFAQLMLGLLIAVSAHMSFEAYAITAGAVQCVILWFIIGAGYQCDTVADYPVFWEDEDPITPEEYVAWREENES